MEVANRDGSARCESIQERKDSAVDGATATQAAEERRGQVRKRGRPPKGQVKVPPLKKREEEEDVCFICFDGGKLVLCDRRGCPKAYHPACIKREEAFFRSKAQWNCGWHICSSCEKAAHYMCYTCTFSVCKTCIKDADFFCVRGNKGFCTTCMKVIMLIENNVQGDKEIVPVDFDDKTSWEYLFKMYWVYLKEKLSLTFEELNRAKNTWKGAVFLSSKGESPDGLFVVSNNKGSKDSSVNIVVNASKRRKVMKQKFVIKEDNQNVVKANVDPGESTKWASNEPCKKHDTRGPQANLDEYAAIDVHNINLIYLKRNMMGDLTGNTEKFSENVVGSVVRIRISSFDQKQDMYKLVQVVGTSKVALPYKVGQRFTNLMIEILNLDKKEAISIDATSNQEFSEDECKCLRESIKCGLANHFTVGEIQKKAMQLREVKLTACLESEILRLSHLHDRTIEKGHRKELKECMEKLQSLNTPEERQRKLQEIPEVHADPSMNPSYEPEAARESNLSATLGNYSFSSNGREPISSWKGNDISKNTGSKLQNSLETTCEPAKNMSTTFHPHKEYASGTHGEVNQGKNACNSCNWEKPDNEVNLTASVTISLNEQALLRSRPSSVPVADTMTSSLSTDIASSASSIEADKIWHYQDPSGKIQGPFCMVELRKWSTTGFFPSDLRIWMTNETQDDYILLSDALHGQFHKGKASQHNHNLGLKDVRVASVDKGDNWEGKSGGTNSTLTEGKQDNGINWHAASPKSSDGSEFLRGEHCSRSSSWNTNADVKSEEPAGMILPGCSSMGGNNSWSNQLQVGGSLVSPTLSGKSCGMVLQQGRKSHEGQEKNPVMDHENESSHGSVFFQTNWGGENSERQYSCDYSGHSSGQNSKSPALCSSPNGWDSNSNLTKSSETSKQHHVNVIPKFSNPIPKPNDVNKLSVGSNVPAQEPGPSWSSASSLAGSGAPHPEVPAEWGRYSPTLERPSVDEWDSNIVSTSLLKLCEAANKALNSNTAQLTDSSTSHPAADASNWQGIGPNEFTSLDEKSVSDLLAEEVDEMELNGMSSPVLIMNCSGEFVHGAKNDCFSPIEVLSPTFDPRKGDALSSTGDFQLSYQTTVPQMNHRG